MNALLYLIISYLVGNILTSFFLGKFILKKDIRFEGSGNAGARNAGRIFGKKYFLFVFLGDSLKGFIVVWSGLYLNFSSEILLLALGCAVLGHIKPALFHFKGGKGVSTFIGGILAFETHLALVIIIGFIITYPLLKSFTLSGLISLFFIPIYMCFFQGSLIDSCIAIAISLIIAIAHKENILERVSVNDRKK